MHGQARARTARSGPDWRRLAPALVAGLVLAGGSAVSLAHLAARWEAQAPVRAERAAAWAAQQAAERAAPVAVAPPADGRASSNEGPSAIVVPGQAAPAPPPLASLRVDPVEWLVEPEYRVSSAAIGAAYRDRPISVDFRCRATVDGRLRGCTAVDRPAGSGLGRVLLPKLDQVRIRPQRVNGEPRETTIAFSLTFRMPSAPAPRPAPAPEPASPPAPSGVALVAPASGGPLTQQSTPSSAEEIPVESLPAD